MSESGSSVETRTGIGQAFVLFGVVLFLVVVIGAVVQLASLSVLGSAAVGLAVTELALILLPSYVFVRLKRVPFREAIRLHPVSWKMLLLSCALGVGGWSIALALHDLLTPFLGSVPGDWLVTASPASLALMLVCGAILPGVCEEAAFRGVLQGVFRRRGARFAIIVSGVLFGLLHLHPSIVVPAALLGMLYGAVVERTGSSVPAMVMHVCNNATGAIVVYFAGESLESVSVLRVALTGVFFATAATVFWVPWQFERRTSPLANVAATFEFRVRMKQAAVATPLLIVLSVFGLREVIASYRMSSDRLAPQVQKGDAVIVLRSRWIKQDVEPGSIIACRRNDRTELRRVIRVEDSNVVIEVDDGESPVPRDSVLGKAIHVVSTSSLGK